jgi:hypothetical protein
VVTGKDALWVCVVRWGRALAARSNLLDGACVASADDQGFEETSHKQGLGSSGKRQHK